MSVCLCVPVEEKTLEGEDQKNEDLCVDLSSTMQLALPTVKSAFFFA